MTTMFGTPSVPAFLPTTTNGSSIQMSLETIEGEEFVVIESPAFEEGVIDFTVGQFAALVAASVELLRGVESSQAHAGCPLSLVP